MGVPLLVAAMMMRELRVEVRGARTPMRNGEKRVFSADVAGDVGGDAAYRWAEGGPGIITSRYGRNQKQVEVLGGRWFGAGGSQTISVTVTTGGATAAGSVSVPLVGVPLPRNRHPRVTGAPGTLSVVRNTSGGHNIYTVDLSPYVTDPDGDTLSIISASITRLPVPGLVRGISVSYSGMALTFRVGYVNETGSPRLRCRSSISDGVNAAVYVSFDIDVSNPS